MANDDFRKAVMMAGVPMYQVAACMNKSPSWISTKLRAELTAEEKKLFMQAIDTAREKVYGG